MDKKDFEYLLPENKTITYGEQEITVKDRLSLAEMAFLIDKYVEAYFEKEEYLTEKTVFHNLDAEYALNFFVVQLLTDIDAQKLPNDAFVDTVLMEAIKEQVQNFYDFEVMLKHVVSEKKEYIWRQGDPAALFKRLVEKAEEALEKFGTISLVDIEQLRNSGLELIKKLEESSFLPEGAQPSKRKRGRPKSKTA